MTTDTRMLKSALFAGCALFALGGTARAADAPAAPAASETAPVTGEIVVTATRRNESIQNVPMTLQALSGDALGKLNVSNFNDLLKYTPNVTFASNGPGQGAIFMRGLSTGFGGNQSSGTVAPFPNVALYLDDQSMQFPARNADVYVADLERIEILEGPQGTLFGGGAEAGAVRYITAKPKLDKFEGHMEGSFGGTSAGAPNGSFNATINVPVLKDTLAVRATIYDDHHGGYIDNVYSAFDRQASDPGSVNYGFIPSPSNQTNGGQYNNADQVKKDYNPIDYVGGRIEALWQMAPDWNLLVTESYQKVDAEGTFAAYPIGSNFQPLGELQTTTFSPSYNIDTYWNTAWTVNGKIADFKMVYTGSYMTRNISEQQDYSNYSRTSGGMYYQCTGVSGGFPGTSPYCYSPVANWNDQIRNTHHTEELRIQSPEGKRIRAIVGAYWEQYKIYDIMRFDYTTIPGCTAGLISASAPCVGVVTTAPAIPATPTTPAIPAAFANQPGNEPAGVTFGEDTQRGYRQLAFYGSLDFDILPTLTLTAGTRYFNYKSYELGSQYQTYTDCYQMLVCPWAHGGNHNIDADNDHHTDHGFKSKVELAWKAADHTLVYGVFSQGFRPGGFNRRGYYILPDQNGVNQYFRPLTYNPDQLTNWEVGLKTDLLDRKVQFNLSAYYMIWNNPPIGVFNPAGGYGNTTFQTNGPSYHIKGAELQIAARPTAGLMVNAGATYNDSKQSSAPLLTVDNPASVNVGQQLTSYYKGSTQIPVLSPFGAIGAVTPFSPHWQADFRARYDWKTSEDLSWFVGGGVSYISGMWNLPSTYPSGDGVSVPGTTTLRYYMPGFAQFDATIGFKHDTWTVSAFGENLGNTHASTFTSSAQFIKSTVPVRPRTYGVKIGTSF